MVRPDPLLQIAWIILIFLKGFLKWSIYVHFNGATPSSHSMKPSSHKVVPHDWLQTSSRRSCSAVHCGLRRQVLGPSWTLRLDPEKLCLAPKFQYLLLYTLLLVTICFGRHFWGIYRYNEISRGIKFSYQVLFSVWLNMQIRLLSLLDSQFWPPTRQLSSTALLRCTCTSALRLADNILIWI